jgi:hypothetical protein
VDEEHRKQIAVWLAEWPVGTRGRQGHLRVTVEAHEVRAGGWPALRLIDETGHHRWCLYGSRGALWPETEEEMP